MKALPPFKEQRGQAKRGRGFFALLRMTEKCVILRSKATKDLPDS